MPYLIIADGTPDQIVETKEQVDRETMPLRAMGCKVESIAFETWELAEAYADKLEGK